jgi:serine/threonine-protein kinase BUR1
MNLLHSLERAEEKPRENTPRLLSLDGTDHPNYFFNYDDTQLPSICGEPGKLYHHSLPLVISNAHRCVFGEMFKGKPILSGNTDLDQARLIFNLVGTPTEENMPGWSSLPSLEGVKDWGSKRGNLGEVFKE